MAAPKLQLDVTLNLAAFRKDLGKVAQTAAAYYYPVNLLINKKNFEAQLKALSKIKPVINIEDSQLIGARARIATLNKSLATLRRATATPIEIKIKYTEVGRPPSGTTAQIGKAVSGGIRADQALQGLSYKQAQAARQMMVAASMPVGALGKNRSMEAYMKSLTEGMKNAGEESIAGLANGLKDGKSAVGQAAKGVGESGLRALKDFWGIASPSRVFKQIGEFAVDGLELGFLNGLKDFKNKSVDEVRKITALLRLEFAKVQNLSGMGGSSMGGLRRQLVGQRAYTSPIGPQPLGSRTPWAAGSAGQFGSSGYEPRMVSRPYTGSPQFPMDLPLAVGGASAMGQKIAGPYPWSNTLRSAQGGYIPSIRSTARFPMSGMMGPSSPNPSYAPRSSFLSFSQRATQVTQQGIGGGVVPPGGFPTDGSIATRATDVLKIRAAMDVASASVKNFTATQLPLIGGLKGLMGEFGEATKQVLLYGTAYKGLAFITSLPGQVLNAAKSQQQFNNALQTATQDTGTFAKELLYVDNVQRAFGLNLETTRTGFTRLYASMGPTGFDSGSIEKLFTGISAATAALQLTPDKAERVIYAFGQMASKGQIMSEELKGQLGDVLPGALAIFAKSAGMSVKEFSEAMEDGEFKGKRFREVFAKVSDELMNRFGTGAQAAGKSLQGLLNTVGGDFQRTLESFAPLANTAAQAILGPLGGALRQLSVSAQIAMGELERIQGQLGTARQDVTDLRAGGGSADQILAAEQNVAALEARYNSLNEALKDPAVAKQVKDLQLLVQELTKAGTFVLNLASAIGGALSPVVNFLGTNLTSVIATITAFYVGFQTARLAAMALMAVLLLYRGLSTLLGFSSAAQQALALSGAFNVLGVSASRAQIQLVGVRLALTALVATTVVGAVVAGIVAIAGAFATMSDKAKEAAQSSNDAAKAAIDAAKAGNVAGAAMGVQGVLTESRKAAGARQALEGIYARATPEQKKGIASMTITAEESVALQGTSLTAGMIKAGVSRGGAREIRVPSTQEMGTIRGQFGSLAGQQAIDLREAKAAAAQAEEVNKRLGLNKPTPAAVTTETAEEAGKKPAKLDVYDQSKLKFIDAQLEKEKQVLDQKRQQNLISETAYQIAVAELELESATQAATEQLRVDKLAINRDNLSAGDKVLKIKDAEIAKENAISIATAKRNIAVEGARRELEGPFNNAIDTANASIIEQQMLLDNIQNGIEELTPDQQAYLQVLGLTKNKSEDEIAILENKGILLRQAIEKQITLNKAVEREKTLLALNNQLTLARILDPRLELREQIRQKDSSLTDDQIEQQALLQERVNAAQKAKEDLQGIASTIGNAFGEAFKGIITGTSSVREALAGLFQSIADSFADMVAQMIAEWLKAQLIKGFQSLFSAALPGLGAAAGGIGGGLSSGFSAGTSSAIDTSAAGWGAAFSTNLQFANGGIASGGFTAFANGGMVTGPTMGLVGEGRYNEAIVPLPDGKSIPVDLGGVAGGMGGEVTSNIVVNINNGQMQGNGNSNGSELGRKIEGAVKQVLVSELRPGGILSSGRR